MNLRFKHVTAKNFLSFRSLDFDIGAFDGHTVLITGYNDDIQGESSKNNGAGKSTLNNTILFAIYGEVLNPLKKATSIRNWSADVSPKEDVEVVLTLDSGSSEYTIQRILKGKKCSQELHVFSRAKGTEDEWNEITLSTIAETQRMIETDIVPCGKEGFLRCVILTADQNYNFFKLNKAAKNSFFESLFELTKYSDMYTKLHRRTLDSSALLTASSKLIDNLNGNIFKLEAEKEESKKNHKEIIDAKNAVSEFKKALIDFDSNTSLSEQLKCKEFEFSDYKSNSVSSMTDRMRKFDSENGIKEVDKSKKIIFDSDYDNSIIIGEMKKYDSENGLTVDSEGNIVFENSDERNRIIEDIKQNDDRILKGRKAVDTVNSDLMSIERKINEEDSNIKNSQKEIRNLENIINSHSNITSILCEDCLPKYMKSVKIDEYPDEIKAIENRITELNEWMEGHIMERDEMKKKLDKYSKGLESIVSKSESLHSELEKIDSNRKMIKSKRELFLERIKSRIESRHSDIQMKRDNFRSSMISEHREKCREYENAIFDMKKDISSKRDEILRNIKNAEYRLSLVENNSDKNYDAPINSLKESLEKEKTNFDALTEDIAHFKALEEVLKPENIRKSVVPDMLKELNFRICGYLAKMGSNYTCKFDDDFEATFISSTGTEAEYNNFSSGEKMRLSIACCLSFRDFMQVRLDFHPNMLVIDEFIDSNLDAMAVSGIMDMIHYMVGTEKISAFIISHRSEIKQDVFDDEILIRKKNNDSKLIVNGFEQ